MCDEIQAAMDDKLYPTVESLPKYTDPVESNGFWGAYKLAENGAVYSVHMRCGRLVQFNHVCAWCHDKKRFPFSNLVWFLSTYEVNTPAMERFVEKEIKEFCCAD